MINVIYPAKGKRLLNHPAKGQSHSPCSITGMANSLRNFFSANTPVSNTPLTLAAITIAAPEMAAQATWPPGARKPRMKCFGVLRQAFAVHQAFARVLLQNQNTVGTASMAATHSLLIQRRQIQHPLRLL